jgi:ATP phosphoribosyltransferase
VADPIIIAVPKGRILADLTPILTRVGIEPEAAFHDPDSRLLRFKTNRPGVDIIRIRAFDVATFVAHGAAHIGIVGSDVLQEFEYSEIYVPVDLGIGHCRVSIAEPGDRCNSFDLASEGRIRVATKYPNITQRHFARLGIQAECVCLNGALEIAPILGLSTTIVDLVSTGKTLRDNGLVEVETIVEVSSRLIVNRAAFKRDSARVMPIIDEFREAVAPINA